MYRSVVTPTIDYDLCQACQRCEAAQHCRYKAFVRFDREEPPYIAVERCNGCGDCAPNCPYFAVVVPQK